MSAEIISFPFRTSTDTEQQRWIPAPRARETRIRPVVGWLRLGGIALAVLSSWGLVIGTARLVATVLL